jgi:hypothetical protein
MLSMRDRPMALSHRKKTQLRRQDSPITRALSGKPSAGVRKPLDSDRMDCEIGA